EIRREPRGGRQPTADSEQLRIRIPSGSEPRAACRSPLPPALRLLLCAHRALPAPGSEVLRRLPLLLPALVAQRAHVEVPYGAPLGLAHVERDADADRKALEELSRVVNLDDPVRG